LEPALIRQCDDDGVNGVMPMVGAVLLAGAQVALRGPGGAVRQLTEDRLQSPKMPQLRRVGALSAKHMVRLGNQAAQIIGRRAGDVRGIHKLPRRKIVGVELFLRESRSFAPRQSAHILLERFEAGRVAAKPLERRPIALLIVHIAETDDLVRK